MKHFYRFCLGALILFLGSCFVVLILMNYDLVWKTLLFGVMAFLAYTVGLALTYQDDEDTKE